NNAGHVAFIARTGTGKWGIWSEGSSGVLELVALQGDRAPGTPDGVDFFQGYSLLGINSAGETAFLGVVAGNGVNQANREGIWSEGGGTGLRLVAREGDPAPGTEEVYRDLWNF